MLSIRLSRVGKRSAPIYRVVVIPKHNDPWAIPTEILGHYNPRKSGLKAGSGSAGQPRELVLNAERVKYWLEKGAQTSDTMWNLLIDEKIVEGKKRNVTTISRTRAKKLEGEATEEKAKMAQRAKKAEEAAEAAKAAAEAPAPEAPAAEEQPAS